MLRCIFWSIASIRRLAHRKIILVKMLNYGFDRESYDGPNRARLQATCGQPADFLCHSARATSSSHHVFPVEFLLPFLHRFIRTRYSMSSQNFCCEYHSPKIMCTEIGLQVYLLQCVRHADRELLRRCHNSQVIHRWDCLKP